MRSLSFSITVWFCWLGMAVAAPVTENKEWEQGCGGSNIEITKVDGKPVSVHAYAEHFHEARDWNCTFSEGRLVAAVYRHYKLKRVQADVEDREDAFKIEMEETEALSFHFPDLEIKGMKPELKEDLLRMLKIAGVEP